MSKDSSVEGSSLESAEAAPAHLIVSQPQKLEGLLETLTLIDSFSERIGEDRSGDLGAGGSSAGGTQQGDDDDQQSARQQAIANMPVEAVMRQQITKHIEGEVKKLRKEVHKAAKKVTKPGSAHKMNDLYARIRRLNALLSELADSSLDIVKRLYVRIFVDKQSVT